MYFLASAIAASALAPAAPSPAAGAAASTAAGGAGLLPGAENPSTAAGGAGAPEGGGASGAEGAGAPAGASPLMRMNLTLALLVARGTLITASWLLPSSAVNLPSWTLLARKPMWPSEPKSSWPPQS